MQESYRRDAEILYRIEGVSTAHLWQWIYLELDKLKYKAITDQVE